MHSTDAVRRLVREEIQPRWAEQLLRSDDGKVESSSADQSSADQSSADQSSGDQNRGGSE
jgi:hypothetical protein